MIEYLVIFPTERQIEYIYKNYAMACNIAIVCQKEISGVYEDRLILLNKDDSYYFKTLKDMSIYVLCCHEEALYWANLYGGDSWKYQFDKKYLNLLTKDKFKDFIKKKSINSSNYYLKSEAKKHLPLIAKPIIGFGSIGVLKINNVDELEQYEAQYNTITNESLISKYKDLYFADQDNKIMYENYVDGRFFRTPFVIHNNNMYIFPLEGRNTYSKKDSDYHWVEFEYVEMNKIPGNILGYFKKMQSVFSLQDGVYVAEFIITHNDEFFLLEMSPRQTSSRIAKIVYYSVGVDIESLAIDIFMKKEVEIAILHDYQVRLRIDRGESLWEEKHLYDLIEEHSDISVYGDRTYIRYYRKK